MVHLRNRLTLVTAGFVLILLFVSLTPARGAITFGKWRDINPANYSSDVTGDLRGIYVRNGGSGSIGAGDGWAVGGTANPIVSHYDGFSWQIVASPVSGALYNSAHLCTNPGAPGVGLCSPNGDGSDGWIVGTAAGVGISVYWDGAALTQITLGLASSTNLTSVFMVCHSPQFSSGCPSGVAFSSGLTVAVGSNSSGVGAIYQFSGNPKSGGGWTQQKVTSLDAVPTTRFNSVYMFQDPSGTLGGFAVGNNGVVARLNGGSWTQMKINPAAMNLKGVFVDKGNPIDAWVAGDGGQIWLFSSGFWSGPVSPGATSNGLTSIFLVSTSEGWMVGTHSTILHSTTLGSSDTWTALTGSLFTATGSGINLLSVSFPSGGNGWAVGNQGVILQTSNSNCGSAVPAPCWGGSTSIVQSSILNAVFEVGTNDAWAGGTFDTLSGITSLIHWDGIKWHRATVTPSSVTTPDIWGIFMLGSSEGWAVGGRSTKPEALKWTGSVWLGQPIANCGLGAEPLSVFMISGGTSGDGWAVGTGGCIWRYQSGSWTPVTSPTTNDLNSVFIQNPGASGGTPAGFAVGKTGTVVELTITGGVPTWSVISPSGITPAQNLYGVYFKDTNHGWIVGGSSTIVSTIDGGSTWSGGTGQVTGAPLATNLTSVFVDRYGTGSGNGDGWAVGHDGSPNVIFAHWDGQFWTNTPLAPPIAASPTGLQLHSVFLTGPQDGFAVGKPVNGGTLSGIMHLDPLYPPTSGGGGGTTTTTYTPSPTTTVSSTSTSTVSTSTSVATSVSTSASSTTAVSTPVTTATITNTPTSAVVTTSAATSSSVSTPLALPPIPGFPWESIIAGIILGMTALAILRRRRK